MQQDYFSHFGMAPSYDLDLKLLGKAYRSLQQQAHPDRHIQADSTTRLKSVTQTAFNTEAYHTLRSAVQRGVYLLQINDVDFSLDNYTVSDMELIMQQLKYREQLADIKENNDESSLVSLSLEAKQHITEICDELSTLFAELTPENITIIQNKLCELQFFDKLQIECDDVEEQLILD
ncbi:MAG: Fe-S protein assembly co-chaperone HscB [Enterobacterales bacterium]|nr:Fe-S protein assembly co-chaperone HscB [Enterobacterales bacterium]